MFTCALAFLQAIDIFVFIFNLFPRKAERGRTNLEESIHDENHWPQPEVNCQAYSVKLIALLACEVLKKTYEL